MLANCTLLRWQLFSSLWLLGYSYRPGNLEIKVLTQLLREFVCLGAHQRSNDGILSHINR